MYEPNSNRSAFFEEVTASYRLRVVGDEKSGKSKLIMRFIRGAYDDIYKHGDALCANSHRRGESEKIISIKDTRIKLQIFESSTLTPCKEAQHEYQLSPIRGWNDAHQPAHGYLLCIDLSTPLDYRKVERWYNAICKEMKERKQTDGVIILVGTKIDDSHMYFSKETVLDLADKFNIPYIEVSAKSGMNIDLAFSGIAEKIFQKRGPLLTPTAITQKSSSPLLPPAPEPTCSPGTCLIL